MDPTSTRPLCNFDAVPKLCLLTVLCGKLKLDLMQEFGGFMREREDVGFNLGTLITEKTFDEVLLLYVNASSILDP
jgi:hypothetical protein